MAEENLQTNGTPEQSVEVGPEPVPDVDIAITTNAEASKPQAELPLEVAPVEEKEEPEPIAEAVPEWARKEINKKHAKNKELERRLAEREVELESLRVIAAKVQGETPPKPTYTPQSDQSAIEAAAAKIVAEREYNSSVNQVNDAGKKAYGQEWDKAIENLVTLGGDGSFTVDVMQGIMATDDPPKVLLELGKNPANYQRIMELSPAKRQTEMVKLAMQPASKARVSAAPPPVEQVGGRTANDAELRDDLSDDEWNARQAQRERARWEQKRGRASGR